MKKTFLNLNQLKAAQTAMLSWLSTPDVLGKAPARLEFGGTFAFEGMNYYVFRFKKENAPLSKWFLGVCGGFEGASMTHTGLVATEMSEYVDATAQSVAEQLISARLHPAQDPAGESQEAQ